MRLVFFGDNSLGARVLSYVREHGAEVVAVVLHPEARRRAGPELLAAAGVAADRIFDGSQLRDPGVIAALRGLAPGVGLSVMFGYIFKRPLLDVFPGGILNLHTSHLPKNRGAYPNVWAIVDKTGAGVTLHYVDDGVDTGDIVAGAPVAIEPSDTGATLQRRLEQEAFTLLQDAWPAVRAGSASRTAQDHAAATTHRVRDVDAIDEIDLDAAVRAGDLIDLLRARTFPPHRGAFFRYHGRRVYLRLELLPEDESA